MIEIYNDGVAHTVTQPQVCIDGTWRDVASEDVNIDGVWKNVFSRDYYVIKLYRYGELMHTLKCTKGSSISLVTVSTIQPDDVSHYGWTKTYGNTTRDYAITASITPTSDMELHAVFKCTKSVVGTKTVTTSSTSTTATTNTIAVETDGVLRIAGHRMLYYSSGGSSSPSELILNTAYSSTANFVGINNSATSTSNMTYVSGTVNASPSVYIENIAVSAGQYVHIQTCGSAYGTTGTYYSYITITYPAMVDETFYRSALGNATVNFYAYGELVESVSTPLVTTITLPSSDDVDSDKFVGWSLSEFTDLTTLPSYKSGDSYKIQNMTINFYAVYHYDTTQEQQNTNKSSSTFYSSTSVTFNVEACPNTNYYLGQVTSTPSQGYTYHDDGSTTWYVNWTTSTTYLIAPLGDVVDESGIINVTKQASLAAKTIYVATGTSEGRTPSGDGVQSNPYSTSAYCYLNYYKWVDINHYRTTK